MMNDIRSDIRLVIAKYGIAAVYKEINAEMRETYDFLRHVYEPPKNNLVIPVNTVIPDRILTPLHKPMNMVLPVDPPHLELTPEEESDFIENIQEHPSEEVSKESQDPNLKEVIIQAKNEMARLSGEKFSKVKHREEVLKKNKELLEKGIKPESLLTKENLTKWLGEGMSYMRIARELVGIHENEIAVIAKTFGLQSDVKKYIVMKKGGK